MNDLWNAQLYNRQHQFVSELGQSALQLLNPTKDEDILDLGCGTGDLTAKIAQHAHVIGIDQSKNMIELAKENYPTLSFMVADACHLPFENKFDAIFSNAVLHWIKTPEMVAQSIFKSLKPGGRFVAEFGGENNVEIITSQLIAQIKQAGFPFQKEDFPWYFPSIAEYTSLLEKIGFKIQLAYHFDRPTPLIGDDGLRNWIEMFSPTFFTKLSSAEKQAIIAQTEIACRPYIWKENQWIADYKRLQIVAYKPI